MWIHMFALDDNSISGGLIGAFALFGANYLVVRFLFKHRRLDEIRKGKSTSLIEDGWLCHGGLAKELLIESKLLAVAHRQGIGTIDEIRHCTLAPGGQLDDLRKLISAG